MLAFICYDVGNKIFSDSNFFLIQMTTITNNPKMEIKLSDIFLELLHKQSYKRITITQIAHKANINRTTFYLYFANKNELLEYSCDRFLIPFIQSFQNNYSPQKENTILNTTHALTAIQPDLSLLKIILEIKEVGFSTEQKIITSVTHLIYKDIQHKYTLIPSEILQYYAHLSAVSLLDTLSWWIQNPCYSPQKLSEIIYVASFEGLHKILKAFP